MLSEECGFTTMSFVNSVDLHVEIVVLSLIEGLPLKNKIRL